MVNVHGSVLVEGWDRDEVEATVAMRSDAPTDQLDDVQVAVEATAAAWPSIPFTPPASTRPSAWITACACLAKCAWTNQHAGRRYRRSRCGRVSIEAHNLHGDIEGINVSGSWWRTR